MSFGFEVRSETDIDDGANFETTTLGGKYPPDLGVRIVAVIMARHGHIDPLLLAADFGGVIAQDHKLAAMTEEAAHAGYLVAHGQGQNLVLFLRRQLDKAGFEMDPGITFDHTEPIQE